MKRMAPLFLALLLIAYGSLTNAQAGCKRKDLDGIVEKYIASLTAHSSSKLPLAFNVKFTENGVEKAVGKGFWETSGKPLLKLTLIDTQKCGAHIHAVMEEKYSAQAVGSPGRGGMSGMMGAKPKPRPEEGVLRPILFGARLKVDKKKITEIETIIARENEFAFNADGVLATKDQDWNSILPPDKRAPRKALIEAANNYFEMFSNDPKVSVPFAKPCDRWENGTQTTAGNHDCSPKGLVLTHPPRRFLVDTEKGLSVAYVLFTGGLPDCHIFRMRDGKVDLIQAVIGAGATSMGWPIEPAE
jgi:hypothetical protein